MVADNLRGLEGLLVGVVGLGTIGAAVAPRPFSAQAARICYHDPAPREGADGSMPRRCRWTICWRKST